MTLKSISTRGISTRTVSRHIAKPAAGTDGHATGSRTVLIRTPTMLSPRILEKGLGLAKGDRRAEVIKPLQDHLVRTGYLPKSAMHGKFDDATEDALKLFQKYARVEPTGRLDEPTLEVLSRPRYDDFPDVPAPAGAPGAVAEALVASASFVDNGVKWTTNDISFSFQNFTGDLTHQQVQAVLRDAFAQWSDCSPLKFYEQPDSASVNIRISFGNIDSPGGVLASTTWWYSGSKINKATITFDEQETWSAANRAGGGQPIELFIVAVHEIGHAIGLGHSADASAVMYAYYNPGLDALANDDIRGATTKYGGDSTKNILADTAVVAPGACAFNGRLFVGWAGTDSQHRLNVIASGDEGVWQDKVTLGDTSPVGVSLCEFNGRLFLAWRGTGNRRLNVMSSADGQHWGGKVTLQETSATRPCLCAHRGQLVMGWTGTDSQRRLNVITSPNGAAWGGKRTLGDTSIDSPALASFANRLFIAWTGTNHNHNLNVMSSANFGASWQNKRILGDTSIAGPTLFAANDLAIAWSGTDSLHRLNVMRSADGINFGNKRTFSDTSDYSPTVTRTYGATGLVWTGRDANRHLNVMTI